MTRRRRNQTRPATANAAIDGEASSSYTSVPERIDSPCGRPSGPVKRAGHDDRRPDGSRRHRRRPGRGLRRIASSPAGRPDRPAHPAGCRRDGRYRWPGSGAGPGAGGSASARGAPPGPVRHRRGRHRPGLWPAPGTGPGGGRRCGRPVRHARRVAVPWRGRARAGGHGRLRRAAHRRIAGRHVAAR